tara:strand:+ start:2131 stop:3492 length:1362 start_codon:yes stop_codon:yes gene_type:complete
MNDNIFRAYDIRGNAEQDLTSDVLIKIGYVLGSKVRDSGSNEIYVGHDSRLSCQRIFNDLCAGINSADIKVLNLGLVPTPIVYYATNVGSTNHGVMITGSHNPKDDNGLKVVLDGGPISGLDILDSVKNININSAGEKNIENVSFEENYINEVVTKSSASKKLKIVLDSGNGAAGILAHKTFEALGHETISINKHPDGNFPNHHPDPSKEKNLIQIKNKISETEADLGLAFDGDGDRVGLITNNGDFVLSDHIIMILAEYYLKQTKGPVVFDVKCSDELGKMIVQHGGEPLMEKTGHFNIKNTIKNTSAILGGEMSGHIFINYEWYGFDDAIFSGAVLSKIIAKSNMSVSKLVDQYPKTYSTPELNLNINDDIKFEMIETFIREMDFADGKINTIDGVRVTINGGWGLLRASNTSPKFVLRFEGDTPENMKKIKEIFERNLQRIFPDLELKYH